jgi:microcystin-dependent protein
MSDYFIGEIRAFSFDWAPNGWVPCDGRLLNVQGNQALFSLLGVQFGGNGTTTFGIPDLRGRVAQGTVSPGQRQGFGYAGGTETVQVTSDQVPAHNHALWAITAAGDKPGPAGNHYANVTTVSPATGNVNIYGPLASPNTVALDPGTIDTAGGGGGHDNMQPFLVTNYCIATIGIYPSRP